MKNYILLTGILLSGITARIHSHDAFKSRPEEIPTSLSANKANLTANRGAIAATIALHPSVEHAGNISNLSGIKKETLIKGINWQLKAIDKKLQLPDGKKVQLTPEEKAVLIYNYPKKETDSWESFNTELDKILTSKSNATSTKIILNHEQIIRDAHTIQTNGIPTTESVGNLLKSPFRPTIKKLPDSLPTRGFTITSTAHNQIISIFPDEMRSLHDELTPDELQKFNGLLTKKVPDIQKANPAVRASLLGLEADSMPAAINMKIKDLKSAITTKSFSDLSDESKNEINAFLLNISHLVDTEVLVGLDGENRAEHIDRLDAGHALHVEEKNYPQIQKMISIFIDNLPNPFSKKAAQPATPPAKDQSEFIIENPTKDLPQKDAFFKNPGKSTTLITAKLEEGNRIAAFRNRSEKSTSSQFSVRDLLPPAQKPASNQDSFNLYS